MRENMKKRLSALLCLLMLVQYLPTTAFAAAENTPGEHTAACTHTGGTATCEAQAVCTACGEAYGDLADHAYDETGKCACGAEKTAAPFSLSTASDMDIDLGDIPGDTKFMIVSFDPNGGSGNRENVVVPVRTEYTIPECAFTPPEGYYFTHWSRIKNIHDKLYPGDRLSSDSTDSIVLNANWAPCINMSGATVTKSGDLAFNGSSQTPSITVTMDGKELTQGTDYTVSCLDADGKTIDPVNAGAYTVVITGIGKYTGTYSKTFAITPGEPDTKWEAPAELTYGDDIATKIPTPQLGRSNVPFTDYEGIPAYFYRDDPASQSDPWLTGFPHTPGSYMLMAELPAYGNYITVKVSTPLTIKPKSIKPIGATIKDVTYDPNGYTFEVTEVFFEGVVEGDTPAYTATAQLGGTNGTNGVGQRTVDVTVSLRDSNYTLSDPNVVTAVSIAKAIPGVTPPSGLKATYGQTLREIPITSAPGDTPGTWTWKDPATVVQVENDGYTAVFTPADTTNYTTKEVTLSVKVSPRTLTITDAVVKDKEYDGDTHTEVENVTFSGLFGSDTLVMGTDYTAKASFSDIIVGEDKSVFVIVTLLNPNYTLSDVSIETSADMLPRKIYQSVYFNPDSLVYNGEPQKPYVGVVDGDIDSGWPIDCTVTFENNVNAGDMTVRVRSDMYLFYQNGDFVSELVLTVPIEKAPVGIGTRYKMVYVGDEMPELEYVVSGLLNNDELLTTPTLTTSADLTKSGAYPITAAGADAGSNYAISYESGLLLVLEKAPATAADVTPDDKAALEDAKEELKNLLAENEGLLTESQTMALWNELQIVEDALEILGNTQDVTDAITRLPETVEPDDEEAATKILAAKAAYNALTDYEKSLVDETIKKKLDDLAAALTDYDIIKGDGSKWTSGDLSFTANGSFSKFVGIEVDGKEVDAKYYDAKAGSTVITLKTSYLDTLAVGEHTITVLYTDGEASGTFLTVERETEGSAPGKPGNPQTGDDANALLWLGMLCVSALSLVFLLAERKRRDFAN